MYYRERYEYILETGEYKGVIKGKEEDKGNGVGGGLYFDDLDKCVVERYDSVYDEQEDETRTHKEYLLSAKDSVESFEKLLKNEDNDMDEKERIDVLSKIAQIKTIMSDIEKICENAFRA